MTREEFEDLINDLTDANTMVEISRQWGASSFHSAHELAEFKKQVMAEYDRLQAEIERLQKRLENESTMSCLTCGHYKSSWCWLHDRKAESEEYCNSWDEK